jgi:hypothetical protein
LTFLKPTLLAKLNKQAGADVITDIALRVGEIPALTQDPAASTYVLQMPSVSEAALVEATAHAAAIQDPELRNRLTQVMAEAFSRSRR